MPTGNEQSFKSHTRWDPVFHFFAAPVAVATFISAVVHAVRHPGPWTVWVAIAVLAAAVMMVRLRMYALMVQDRVIRLEERLRLASLCSEAFRSRIPELKLAQLIALRFASDGEVAPLAERALASNLTSKQIKEAIQVWRPDPRRV